jgi:hypothetical protein
MPLTPHPVNSQQDAITLGFSRNSLDAAELHATRGGSHRQGGGKGRDRNGGQKRALVSDQDVIKWRDATGFCCQTSVCTTHSRTKRPKLIECMRHEASQRAVSLALEQEAEMPKTHSPHMYASKKVLESD